MDAIEPGFRSILGIPWFGIRNTEQEIELLPFWDRLEDLSDDSGRVSAYLASRDSIGNGTSIVAEAELSNIGQIPHDLVGLRHWDDGSVAICVCIDRCHLVGVQRL